MTVNELANQFISGVLPKSQWTHEAHLCVGLWHVLNHHEQAMNLLRERIRAYNEAVGTPNTDTGGYHETITQFYVVMIVKFLASADRDQSIDKLAQQLLSQYGDRGLPLQYYSRDLLFSVTARKQWVEPDLSRL